MDPRMDDSAAFLDDTLVGMPPPAATGGAADQDRRQLPDHPIADGAQWAGVALDAHVANYFVCAADWQLPERTRPHYQLWLITGGLATFTLDRGSRTELGPRSALVVPPGVRHRGSHDPTQPLRCFVIHFVVRRHGQPTNVLWPTSTTSDFAAEYWRRLLESAAELCDELKRPSSESALLASASLARLLGLIRRAARTGAACFHRLGSATSNVSAVTAVLAYIDEHYARDLSLSDLCAAASVSPGHLNHLFRTTLGVAPMEYLRRHRLDRAKVLLEETDLSVADVADAVGYRDAFHFSRTFRRLEGLAPSRYRSLRLSDEV